MSGTREIMSYGTGVGEIQLDRKYQPKRKKSLVTRRRKLKKGDSQPRSAQPTSNDATSLRTKESTQTPVKTVRKSSNRKGKRKSDNTKDSVSPPGGGGGQERGNESANQRRVITQNQKKFNTNSNAPEPRTGSNPGTEMKPALTESQLIDQTVARYDKNAPVDPEWYSHQLIRSFFPLRLVMHCFFRFPIYLNRNVIDKYEFTFKKCHILTFLFILVTLLNLLLTLLFMVNLIGTITNYPSQDLYAKKNVKDYAGGNESLTPEILRAEELYIYKRNFVPVVVVFTCLLQRTVASIFFFWRRKLVAYFLSFFIHSAEITRINFAHGLISFMWIFMTVVVLTAVNFAPAVSGTRAVIVQMAYRCFEPAIFADPWLPGAFHGLKIFHGVFFLFTFVTSKIYLIFFMWLCRLIRNGFIVWNHRIDSVLLKDEKERSDAERLINRTGFREMFTDHVILIDLIQGLDRLFAGTCEMYYLTQAISICFEFYYLIRSQMNPYEFDSIRQRDGIIILIFSIQSCILLFYVTMTAANINDEAIEGLEVIRRKGMMGRLEDPELYFILSMYASYTGHFDIAIVCGNYVVMNKGFFITVLNSVCMFLLIIAQISPPLTLTDVKELNVLRQGQREPLIKFQTEGHILGTT